MSLLAATLAEKVVQVVIVVVNKIIDFSLAYLKDFLYLCIIKPSFITHLCYKEIKILKVWVAQNLRPVISLTSSHAQPGSNSNRC